MAKSRRVVLPAASLVGLLTWVDGAVAQEAPSAPLANLCLAAEYVYAGSRLLAVAPGDLPTVTLAAASSAPNEATGVAPVSVIVTTVGGCPTVGGDVSVQYSTGAGTATPNVDYTAVPAIPAVYLNIPAGTASGTSFPVNIALNNDLLDEDPETFTVNLVAAKGATLGGLLTHTVTIVDDDPEPALFVSDASGTEPETLPATISNTVTLSPASGRTVTVRYSTGGGTATPHSPTEAGDYEPVSALLTFPPGTTSRLVDVLVYPDELDEPSETYFVSLTDLINANAAISDLQGQGTINDSPADLPPTVSVFPASTLEGDDGVNRLAVTVQLSNPSAFPITVNYATADGTAVATRDYVAASGQLSFSPGDTVEQPQVEILTDSQPEPNEYFLFNLSSPQNATLGTAQAQIFINNDDPQSQAAAELTHGYEQAQDLRALSGAASTDWYRIGQKPRSSYEVMVDATSGDIGIAYGPELQRIQWDLTTVLQNSVAVTPGPAGVGNSKTLRWRNTHHFGVNGQFVIVKSAQCGADCGPDDVYRIRAFDTTGSVPRFNNSGTQTTILVIQNVGAVSFGGTVDYWDANGVYLTSTPFFALPPMATFTYNTSLAVPGLSGSMTIMHDGGYGDLMGKAIAIEPATGFSFDTPIVPRPR